MRKEEVVERLCTLVTEVAASALPDECLTHDCFCHHAMFQGDPNYNPVVDDKIIKFIEEAVRSRLE